MRPVIWIVAGMTLLFGCPAHGAAPFSLAQVLGYTFASHLTGASRAGELAWVMNVRGVRNIWIARAPGYGPREVTRYTKDDGLELINLELSPDGSHLIYVRGGDEDQNWPAAHDVQPDPSSMPQQVYRELWSIDLEAPNPEPKLLAEHARGAVISPDGKTVVYEQLVTGQLWSVSISGSHPASQMFWNRGRLSDARFSPDGRELAFVTTRNTHSFIGIYRGANEPIEYLEPSTAYDSSPRWSPDGRYIAFIRQPGATAGYMPAHLLQLQPQRWAIWRGDARTGEAVKLWEAPDTLLGSYPSWGESGHANLAWVHGEQLAFIASLDGHWHLYTLPATPNMPNTSPRLLTPGSFMVDSVRIAPDAQSILFNANSGPSKLDIDRKHVSSVDVTTGKVSELTPGSGLQWAPVATSDDKYVAYISATSRRPPLITLLDRASGESKQLQLDLIPKTFPADDLVIPRQVIIPSTDNLMIHCQLFETAAGSKGRHPAIIYVHGGPERQMLLGWHDLRYYDNDYAVNQYLAAQGFVVLSVNYRDSVGYGWNFTHPVRADWRGASEYDDVLAAAKYLQKDPNVDAGKIGIWGGSYGGFLVGYALARNSDIFAAGVDRHGDENHITYPPLQKMFEQYFFLSQYEKTDFKQAMKIAWESSPDAWVAHWKSPVMLIQGDDDRNVPFFHMVGLVQRLSKYHVPYQELVIPDEVHTFLRWQSWYVADRATVEFFDRQLLGKE
jgi:dipeptidyl aminopeptidase/acylaminoacyl peptidase